MIDHVRGSSLASALDVVVTTPRGAVVGAKAADGLSVSFKGIPYAQPPVGDLRWRAPTPSGSWQGVFQAKAVGPAAMQHILPEGLFYADNPPSMSEDCLTLNVWSPPGATDAPVMVWIHGGNLVFGSGVNPRYDGAALARLGVVVVSINYRLGVFGYFAHPELSAESAHGVSGNYGTLDQIEALRWVRENIPAFGGDADNITVFGQSAGALSVTHLMSSPLASGLFHRAIAMSAYLPAMPKLRVPALGLASAEAIGEAFGRQAGATSLSELRGLSAEALLNAMGHAGFVTEGVVDGWVHPGQIFDRFASGDQAKIPLIIGLTSDETRSFEGQGFLPTPPSHPQTYQALVECLYGEFSAPYLALYPAANPVASMHEATTDAYFGHSVLSLARDHAATGSPTFLYSFQHVYASADAMHLGAFHSADVPFVFGNVGPGAIAPINWPSPPAGGADIALSKAMMAYWIAFAREGRPDVAELAAWERFNGPSGPYMAFEDGRASTSFGLRPRAFDLNEQLIAMKRGRGLAWWKWVNIGLCMQGVNAPSPAK